MRELFGIPLGTLLAILGVALGVVGGVVGVLALRNPILVKLSVRNLGRRRGRTALIVVGLMLGTTIIGAALVTGDTMSHTIRSTAIKALGSTDEVIAVKGAADDIAGDLGSATGTGYFDASLVPTIETGLRATGLVDGVTGVIIEQVAVQAPRTRQTEPSVALFAPDPSRLAGFGTIRDVAADADFELGSLEPTEVLLNRKAAEELGVVGGDTIKLYAGPTSAQLTVRAVVRFDGTGTADAAVLTTLEQAQALLAKEGRVKYVIVSNLGAEISGAELSDRVAKAVEPTLKPLGLEIEKVKQDAIEVADETGSAFMAFFTTFGTFSIAAGILLIVLIFVMLAAERRGELGIARAIGTRRSHLVQMFTFEGAAYDLAAAIVGAVLGAFVAWGMVTLLAQAFDTSEADAGLQIEYSVTWRSLLIALALGLLLSLTVVAFSAWRVSVTTISAAIRNLPEPTTVRQRRRVVLGGLALVIGLLLAVSGVQGGQATPLMLGVSLVLVALIPILRALGVPDRVAFTSCGLTIVVLLLLPWRYWEDVFGQLSMNFSTWISTGLMIVVGTAWTIVYNADLVLPALMRLLSPIGRLAPVLRISMAYPLAARFRTGATLSMFTLVVFTLVTGSASTASFNAAFSDVENFGGGFQVRASTNGAAPLTDIAGAIQSANGLRASDFRAVGSQSVLAVDATQVGAGRSSETYIARGLDDPFLKSTTFGIGAFARGYASAAEVWQALREQPGLAVVDSFIVPRRDNFGFSAGLPDFRLSGFYYDEGSFDPVPVTMRDPQTGRELRVTVIGVLEETAPFEMIGLSVSNRTLEQAFPGRAAPTIHYFQTTPGVDPETAAASLEAAFLANGLEAESIQSAVDDAVAINRTFNRVIQGFMGLGLLVGVAALGVISARAVVERRQHIGVLRAIGFRRGMVQASFLVESAMMALTSLVVGTGLGILLAWNIVTDSQRQPSWRDLTLVVPWADLVIVYAVVILVAFAATLAPAIRASRIAPAEALRYQ